MMNILNALTKAYTEPHRRYHTIEHIAHMFNVAREHSIQLTDAQVQAIWWHDAVYKPGFNDNETQSISLMLYNVSKNEYEQDVIDMIRDTENHMPHSEESAIICDLDMFGFVESTSKHRSINQQIEMEFMLTNMALDEYRVGRIQFLENLLTKPVFHSEVFKKYNEHAHERILIDITHCK